MMATDMLSGNLAYIGQPRTTGRSPGVASRRRFLAPPGYGPELFRRPGRLAVDLERRRPGLLDLGNDLVRERHVVEVLRELGAVLVAPVEEFERRNHVGILAVRVHE